jgi:hypothetical protein
MLIEGSKLIAPGGRAASSIRSAVGKAKGGGDGSQHRRATGRKSQPVAPTLADIGISKEHSALAVEAARQQGPVNGTLFPFRLQVERPARGDFNFVTSGDKVKSLIMRRVPLGHYPGTGIARPHRLCSSPGRGTRAK